MGNAVHTGMCDENFEYGFDNAEETMVEEVESFHDVESLDGNDWDDVGFGKNLENLGTMESSTDFLSETGGESAENVPWSEVSTDAVTVDSWEEETLMVPPFSSGPSVL